MNSKAPAPGMGHARPVLFFAGLALMLLAGILSYVQITDQSSDADRVDHTKQVLARIAALRVHVLSAQNSRRAYGLTSEPKYREELKATLPEIRSTASELARLTADNPRQQERVTRLVPRLEQKIDHMLRHMEGPSDLSKEPKVLPEADRLMQEVFRVLDEIEGEERMLLAERRAEAKASVKATLGFSVGGGVLGIALFLAALALLVRENRERRRAEATAREVNAWLEGANRAIAVAGEQLKAFFETSLDLACVADLDGYFKKLNPSWERVLGWSQEELRAHPWLEFVHPDDREHTIRAAEKLGVGAPVLQFENRYRCKDGSYRWLSWSTPAPAPGSTTLYALARDVTDLKAHEEALKSLNSRLQQANEDLESFSYSVSHDLRAPLRHANGFVELLEKQATGALDDKAKRYLRTISDATRKMGRLIDDLLAFSRTGRAQMRPARVFMTKLVEEVWSDLAGEAEGRKIAWEVKPLPDATGDYALLRQVWMNLLSNAMKYTTRREDARVEVGSEAGNGQGAVFYVRDNGAGFDMRYSDKLFGVFQRLHSEQEFEGTGIGLANAKRIVARHGGKIWAEGKVGEGATFYFTLPLGGEERR